MVKINKIYTRTGDEGFTHLVDGSRVKKDDLRVECYGTVDELNSFLGMVRTLSEREQDSELSELSERIQHELFDLGAELACPPGEVSERIPKTLAVHVQKLEQAIDRATEGLPELRSFVLPGGSEINSYLHICRTVCRRAERLCIALAEVEDVRDEAVHYLNRLSDLFFALTRRERHRIGASEYLWIPSTKKES